MNKLLPDMLFPGDVWLYWWLKNLYMGGALERAGAFLSVTGWIAKAASGRRLIQNFRRDLRQPVVGVRGVSFVGS